jgi:hypothetical protein
MNRPIYVALTLVLAALVAACAGDDEEEVSPSPGRTSPPPTASTTATLEPSTAPTATAAVRDEAGFDGFRAFAPSIDTAVEAGDVDFFLARASPSTVTCPNEFEPMCVGQPDGSTVDGVWQLFWQSEGYLLTPDGLETALSGLLSASPEPALLAIAGDDSEGIAGGPASFAVVGPPGSDQALRVLEFAFADGEWQLKAIIDVPAGASGEWLSGDCMDCYDEFEAWTTATRSGY